MIYIAGPISGAQLEQRQKEFKKAEFILKKQFGPFNVVNPMNHPPHCQGCASSGPVERKGDRHARKCYLKWDIIRMLVICEGVALLPGWENSEGAKMEKLIAEHCGLTVKTLDEWLS